ncbi:MAG: hypothetical protein APF76_05770 [Desulfitibacter sp. BRH_c19]|nr:MAG: hypothetical protein APF76_05770 [Desulfitibacter sp. BRH_c19]
MKKAIVSVSKIVLLTLIYGVCFTIPAIIFPLSPHLTISPSEAQATSLMFILFLSINTLVLSLLTIYSKWSGLKLIGSMIIVFFGLQTFMTQIETYFFIEAFPLLNNSDFIMLVLRGFITAVLFVPFLVWLLGKTKPKLGDIQFYNRTIIVFKSWAWKWLLLSGVYVVIYFIFGYFIAWQYPEVRQFYSGSTDITGIWNHLLHVLNTNPEIFLFQFIRGALWILFAIPIVLMLREDKWKVVVILILLLGLLPTTQLMLSNPLMPSVVRIAHLIEVSISMAIFGGLIGVLLYNPNHGIGQFYRKYQNPW